MVYHEAGTQVASPTLRQAFGRIDALVNNAGATKFCAHDDLEGLSAEDFQSLYAINTVGPFQVTRACVPHMAAGSSVVNVSSVAGKAGTGLWTRCWITRRAVVPRARYRLHTRTLRISGSSIAYVASKGALNSLTLSLARALGPKGIRVNAVCPSVIEGEWMRRGMGEERFGAYFDEFRMLAPMRQTVLDADSPRRFGRRACSLDARQHFTRSSLHGTNDTNMRGL